MILSRARFRRQALTLLAAFGFLASPLAAGTMVSSPSAPAVDSFDIANYGAVTGNDKWWPENNDGTGGCKGQTFTTGPAAVEFRAVSYQITASQQAQPAKTYVVRVGTVAGTTFTEIHSETFTQTFTWNGGEFMTWTFDNPPVLTGNTTYAVDIGLTGSTSAWQTGIPYINRTGNDYPGGDRYRSGTSGVGGTDMTIESGDRIFHLDLAVPPGTGLQFVAGVPPDDSAAALLPPELVATFNQNLVLGAGHVTIRNLTDRIDTPIPVSDPRLSITNNLLLIETPGVIDWNKSYSIWIDAGALRSDTGDIFGGIADDSTWNFTTAEGDPLLLAIRDLKDHINGVVTLSPTQIEALKQTIDAEKRRFDDNAANIAAVFDLVTTYDTVVGPLFVPGSPVQSFSRDTVTDQNFDWVIYHVMQYIMDQVYHATTLANHEVLLAGFKFGSSAHFPGSVEPPADPGNTHTATINASFPDTFGRDTQGWTLAARKPTGAYLAPGTMATVTVPPALVGRGYQVRVGAHSWDLQNRSPVRRLERATIVYALDAATIKIASPYGGGIYIEVPFRADAGVVTVDITGAVRAPCFSAKSFHATTLSEWLNTERNHPAPWADFQSDKFMMQVPRSWIYNLADPVTLMADWDAAMDAINDLMGFPRLRGKETMYLQPDLILRSSVHAPGYPAVNVTHNPNSNYGGYANNYLVRGPRHGSDIEFHEQGHAYFFPKFGGETESNVNLLHVAVLHRKFGSSLDYAFAASLNYESNPHRTLDNTAVAWMTVFNFSPREAPMAEAEKAYQLKGHAKFADIVRLFGWTGLDAYWYSFNADEENGLAYSTATDSLLLRLSKSVGTDLRPLFHFWGVHPQNPITLGASMAAEGLRAPAEIYDLLHHYKSLVPADNAAFRTFALGWWGRQPSINGYWEEREHARQWDANVLWDPPVRPNGEIFDETASAEVQARVQELIDLYYPSLDYNAWAATYPGLELGDPAADLDDDGLNNALESWYGTNPGQSNAGLAILGTDGITSTFTHPRNPVPPSDVSSACRWSVNLVDWYPSGSGPDGGPVVTLRSTNAGSLTTVTATASEVLANLFLRMAATRD